MLFQRLKIKHKLLLINLLILSILFLISGLLWLYKDHHQNNQFLNQRIESQAALVSSHALAAVIFDDSEVLIDIISALKFDQAITSATIKSINDTVLAKVNFNRGPTNATFPIGKLFNEELKYLQIIAPVMDNQATIAYLEVNYSNLEVLKKSRQSFLFILGAISLALFVATLLLHFMQRVITRPIKLLSNTAREVTRTNNYSLRVKSIYFDELGELSDNFNIMLQLIDERTHGLENLVKLRTQALEQTNKELTEQILATQQSEESRLETEARFQQAFYKAPIGMALMKDNCKVFSRNQRFEQLLGLSEVEDICMLEIVANHDKSQIENYAKKMVSGKISQCELEVSCKTLTGQLIHTVFSMSSVKDQQGKFRYAVVQMQDVTESKQLHSELEHQASHDPLTGLANRRILRHSLTLLNTKGFDDNDTHGLCMIDLDQFKIVNDTCGHAAGDELLKIVATTIKQHIRDDDVAVRLGGDEFALILYQCDTSHVKEVCEQLLSKIEQIEFSWDNKTFRVSASIGAVMLYTNIPNVSDVIKQADAACYAAKDTGRNRIYMVQGEDQHILQRQGEFAWVQRLHKAIEKDEFVLFTQPIFAVENTTKAQHHEVLIRLLDDDTLVPPNAFLSVAERYGLSSKIDRWVIQSLIDGIHTKAIPQQSYWVNLSGVSLGDNEFLDFLEGTIKEASLPDGMINFEITETAVIKNISKATVVMNNLKQLGCHFALDDFGSGVSSFGYLKNLPVEIIKIDGLFIRDILDDEMDLIFVKSIIDIAKVLDIKIVAEFVESTAVLEKLIELGADYAQGFALGEPSALFLTEHIL